MEESPMQMCRYVVATMLGVIVLSPCTSHAKVEYLEEEPPKGTLPYGHVVYVDDGTCPSGEVKEITGGSLQKGISRKVRCVKRPD